MTPAPRRQAIEAAAKAAYEAEWGTCPSSAPNKMLDQYLRVMEIGIAAYEAALWRPISEAPRDGQRILAAFKGQFGWVQFAAIAFGPESRAVGYAKPDFFRPLPAPPRDPETKP